MAIKKRIRVAIETGIEEGDIVRQFCPCGCSVPLNEGKVFFRIIDGEEIPVIRNYLKMTDTPLNLYDEDGNLAKVEILVKNNESHS